MRTNTRASERARRSQQSGADQHFPHTAKVKKDGSYRIVGLPGPGVLGVYGPKTHYLRASQRNDEFGSKGLSGEEYPSRLRGGNCGALTRVSPAKGVASLKRDVTLDPGWRMKGTILGPDRKPLAGTRSFLLVGHWWDREVTRTAEFTAWFNPHEAGEILFQHPEGVLVGVAEHPKVNGSHVTVQMGRGSAVTGRLVDSGGRPRAGVELEVTFRPKGWGDWFGYSQDPVRTDREGRFRVGAHWPGYEFRLSDGKGDLPFGGPCLGLSEDLGHVRVKVKAIDR